MTTRRGFLEGAAGAGLVFCSCGLLDAARAQDAPRRLPVTIKGKRIRTVDAHAHCYFQKSLDLMGEDETKRILPPTKGLREHFFVIEERLEEMDNMGIDTEILSINPFWY